MAKTAAKNKLGSPVIPPTGGTDKRMVRCAVTQASNVLDAKHPLDKIKKAMIDKHVEFVKQAARDSVNIICFQELFYAPYFCAEQEPRWYDTAERIEDSPTLRTFGELAKKHQMVIIAPIYEKTLDGVYYNTAAVINIQGKVEGIYRKTHIPHCKPAFWEKFYFKPGNLGFPTFQTPWGRIGLYICYDRHFPEGARALGLNGAEIVFIPSATTSGHSDYLWKIEQVSHAVANGYFVGTCNRVGYEAPWNFGKFYGTSYFCNPKGKILVEGNDTDDAVVTADLNLNEVAEIRNYWQFFRDRAPQFYKELTELKN